MTKTEHTHKHRSDFRFDHDGMWPHHHDYETDQPIWWEGPIPAPAEATAAAEQRLEGLEGAARELLDAESQPAYSWVIESQRARAEGTPNREVERMDRIARARRDLHILLDTPPPAPPRQGEPVDVERLARALRSENAADWFALIEGEKWPDGQRLSEGFAGDFARALAAEYAALSEPAEASEP